MKLVYIRHLKCRVIYGMRVRVPLRPPKKQKTKIGLERAEAKQDNFQQKIIVVCLDECDQVSIQLCSGQGMSE
jgi:hypothetical protein